MTTEIDCFVSRQEEDLHNSPELITNYSGMLCEEARRAFESTREIAKQVNSVLN